MKTKLIQIYLPSIGAFLVLMVFYSLSYRWLMKISDFITGLLYMVIVLGLGILITWLLTRRIKMLHFGKHTDTWRSVYCLTHGILFTVPFIFLQGFLLATSYHFEALKSINEIEPASPSEFYTIDGGYIHKEAYTQAYMVEPLYILPDEAVIETAIVAPVFAQAADTGGRPLAWLGLSQSQAWARGLDSTSSRLLTDHHFNEMNALMQDITLSTYQLYGNANLFHVPGAFKEALAQQPSYRAGDILLRPANYQMAHNQHARLAVFVAATLGGWLILLWLIYIARPIESIH